MMMEERTDRESTLFLAKMPLRILRLSRMLFCKRIHYSVIKDFGKIYPIRRERGSPELAGHRSLPAAKAANDFTRNCVLGFSRNWYFQIGSVIRGCAECSYGTLRTLIRISYSGLPVPLLRYGARYALFMSSAMRWTRMSRCPTFEIRRRE